MAFCLQESNLIKCVFAFSGFQCLQSFKNTFLPKFECFVAGNIILTVVSPSALKTSTLNVFERVMEDSWFIHLTLYREDTTIKTQWLPCKSAWVNENQMDISERDPVVH